MKVINTPITFEEIVMVMINYKTEGLTDWLIVPWAQRVDERLTVENNSLLKAVGLLRANSRLTAGSQGKQLTEIRTERTIDCLID